MPVVVVVNSSCVTIGVVVVVAVVVVKDVVVVTGVVVLGSSKSHSSRLSAVLQHFFGIKGKQCIFQRSMVNEDTML